MTNKEHLEEIKRLDGDLGLNLEQIVRDEEGDSYRKTRALEIIAEELIGVREELTIIANELMAIKNLQ